jgi:hypothetical protein
MKIFLSLLLVLISFNLKPQSNNCYKILTAPTGYVFQQNTSYVAQNIVSCADSTYAVSFVLLDENDNSANNIIVKYDADMNVLWSKELKVSGFPERGYEFNKMTELANGDLYIYFSARDIDYYTNHFIVRMNNTGNVLWSKNFYVDYTGTQYLTPKLKVNEDEELLVVLSHFTQIDVVKLDNTGNIVFGYAMKTDSIKNPAFDCEFTHDKGAIVTAKSSFDNEFIKIDSLGNVQWANRMHDANYYCQPRSISRCADGNMLVAGLALTTSNRGMLMKMDTLGNKIWMKEYYSSLFPMDGFDEVKVLANGHILLFEYLQAKVIECDANGNVLTSRILDSQSALGFEMANQHFSFLGTKFNPQLNDLSMVFVRSDMSFSNSCMFVNYSGLYAINSPYNPIITHNISTEALDFSTFPDSAVVASDFNEYIVFEDYCANLTGMVDRSASVLNVYPNPAADQINIEMKSGHAVGQLILFNASGQPVKMIAAGSFHDKMSMDVSELPNGIYLLKAGISSDGPIASKTIMINH